MKFKTVWLISWGILVAICIAALVDVTHITCGSKTILLSRSLTTDPWRGVILVFNLLAVSSSFYFDSIFMVAGFLGFLCAFLVSMFQTDAHNFLILISTVLIMYECFPNKTAQTTKLCGLSAKTIWYFHWTITVIFGLVFFAWMIGVEINCIQERRASCLEHGNEKDCSIWEMYRDETNDITCAECDWWYIAEYLFFWSMFLLVWWRIDDEQNLHDNFQFTSKNNEIEELRNKIKSLEKLLAPATDVDLQNNDLQNKLDF